MPPATKIRKGLTEPGHTTTARDLSILATRLMRDFPEYVGYYAIKKYRYEGTPAANDSNRNLLLFPRPDGGWLEDRAHRCRRLLPDCHGPARRSRTLGQPGPRRSPESLGSRRLLSIVLGAASENARANESQKLLNWGYTAFEAVKLFDANQAVVTPAVWKGKAATVALGQTARHCGGGAGGHGRQAQDPGGAAGPLVAPFEQGPTGGPAQNQQRRPAVVDVPLLALEGVEQAGVFGPGLGRDLRLWIK